MKQAGLIAERAPLLTLSGTVVAVGADSIEIEANYSASDPLGERPPQQRRVTIGTDTKISRMIAKTAAEYEADFQAYEREMRAFEAAGGQEGTGREEPEPVSLDKPIVVGSSAIKKGDRVNVTANEDISRSPVIAAEEIVILNDSADTGPAPGQVDFTSPASAWSETP
jgi:hypothetical protein